MNKRKMKTYKMFLLPIMALLCLVGFSNLFTACGSDEPEGGETDAVKETIVLRKSSIDEGEKIEAEQVSLLTLEYNTVVAIAPNAAITLNGAKAEAHVSKTTAMKVEIDLALEEGKEYTLSIPSGSIVGQNDAKATAPTFTLHFSTNKYEAPDVAQTLCDKQANADAQALYKQLLSYYGRTIISGVMCDVAWNQKTADQIFGWVGKRPVLNGYDYIHLAWSPANWIDYTDVSPVTNWTKDGGIAACMYHFNVPSSEATVPVDNKDQKNLEQMTCTPEKTTFKARNCFVDGTWEKAFYDRQIEKLIAQIKLLQDAHVAILWRPYHEAKGNTGLYNGSGKAWFWWGTDGPDVFKKLWLDMYERFQKADLHNLIWVFTDSTDNLSLDWYPGDEYVDIVGADVYNKTTAKACADVFKGLEKVYPHKMITLSECGNVADLQSQWNAGAKWLWAMPWYGGGDNPHYTQQWWQQAANSTNVLMR